jgi:hypothetical protein
LAVILAYRLKQPVKFEGSVLAMIPVTENEAGAGGMGADLTVVIADLVTVPVELVALIV